MLYLGLEEQELLLVGVRLYNLIDVQGQAERVRVNPVPLQDNLRCEFYGHAVRIDRTAGLERSRLASRHRSKGLGCINDKDAPNP